LHVHQEMRVGPFTLQVRAGRALHADTPLPLTQTGPSTWDQTMVSSMPSI
jgi:hypothetical protein